MTARTSTASSQQPQTAPDVRSERINLSYRYGTIGIKSVAAAAFRTQGRGGRGVQGARLKEEDLVSQVVHTSAHAFLLLFSNQGKVYRLRGHEIPMKDRTARGTAAISCPCSSRRVTRTAAPCRIVSCATS